jgi:hypothetical protein
MSAQCPLFPRKLTFIGALGMSAKRAAVPLIYSRATYLLVDELILADRCAGTTPLARLFQMYRV